MVEVRSGEGERERKGSRAIRVRVADEEEPPGAPAAPVVTAEGSDSLKVSWREPENRGPEIVDYEVRYREGGEAGYSDGGHEGTGLEVRLSGLEEGTAYQVQVRAVNEEGISEWSEPGEGRTDSEEPDPDDPSDFTGEDLEGRRLTLRNTGEEGSTGSLELRFGEGNRFEQIESVGEQAATRSEGTSRSGSYAYQWTGPLMGRLSLTYDDGSSCEVLFTFTEARAGTFVYDCGRDPGEGSFRLTTGSVFVPVILSAAGQNQSFFTSELTLANRGEREERLDYLYTAHIGGGSGRASEVLAPGVQKTETDALGHLRGLGIPIPETGNRIGTLWVEVRLGSEVEAVVRTTTAVPEGRAGLAYLGVAEEEGFTEAVYLCGLRQNSRDRSNVAFQNMGAEEEGAITVRTTVYSGESTDTNARVLEDVTLEPGEFHQYSGLLGVLESVEGNRQGYVKVERVEGTAPFYAYGVINDQANSDGSFVFPVAASWLEGRMGQTLPVIVETSAFTSELTVTNFSGEARRLDFQFVAEGIEAAGNTAAFSMRLEAGRQEIIAEVVEELRQRGVAGLGSTRGFYAGPLFVVAEGGDMSGIVIGARTGSEGGGGQYSVFYNAVPEVRAFSRGGLGGWTAAGPGEPQQPGAGQHRGGGRERQRLPSGDLRRRDRVAGRDGGHQADPGPRLASDQRHSGQLRSGDPAGVYPDREDIRGEPLPGLRSGQRRRRPGRAQRRRSLPAGPGVGGLPIQLHVSQPAFLTGGLHSSQECNLAQEFFPQRVLASEERSGDTI